MAVAGSVPGRPARPARRVPPLRSVPPCSRTPGGGSARGCSAPSPWKRAASCRCGVTCRDHLAAIPSAGPVAVWRRPARRGSGRLPGAAGRGTEPGRQLRFQAARSSQLQPCHRCELRRRAAKARFYFSSCFLFSDLTAACPAGRQSLSAAGLARLWVGSADALAACY